MAASGLHAGSSPEDYVRVIDVLHNQVLELQASVVKLTGEKTGGQKRNITEYKSFEKVPHYDGEEKIFTDFEFKLQQFLQPFPTFEQLLDWAKELENAPTIETRLEGDGDTLGSCTTHTIYYSTIGAVT